MMEVIIGEINWIYRRINTIGSGVDLIIVDKTNTNTANDELS